METMLEYLSYTKGWEYVITIAVVIVFMVLWQTLSREKKPEQKKSPR